MTCDEFAFGIALGNGTKCFFTAKSPQRIIRKTYKSPANQKRFFMSLKTYYDGVFSNGDLSWDDAPGKSVIVAAMRLFLNRGIIKNNANIVDIGCGNGFLLNRLYQEVSRDFSLYGVDFFNVAVERGKSLFPHLKLFCEDGAATRFRDKEFDVLISYGSYEHFPLPGAGIHEASRLLSDDGIFLAMMPTLGINRTDRDDEGWYEELTAPGAGVRQMQWNLRRNTWESYLKSAGMNLLDDSFAVNSGALKPGVFFFASKRYCDALVPAHV
jgi:SAM-dependent methyltransferase